MFTNWRWNLEPCRPSTVLGHVSIDQGDTTDTPVLDLEGQSSLGNKQLITKWAIFYTYPCVAVPLKLSLINILAPGQCQGTRVILNITWSTTLKWCNNYSTVCKRMLQVCILSIYPSISVCIHTHNKSISLWWSFFMMKLCLRAHTHPECKTHHASYHNIRICNFNQKPIALYKHYPMVIYTVTFI